MHISEHARALRACVALAPLPVAAALARALER
jgi:hypothetical protein